MPRKIAGNEMSRTLPLSPAIRMPSVVFDRAIQR